MSSRFNQTSEFKQLNDDDIPVIAGSTSASSPTKDHEAIIVAPSVDEAETFDDAPGYFSWNPIDWYKDLKREYDEFTWTMDERKRVLLRAVFGEGLVTFLFLFIVEATAVNNGRQENPENLVLGAISTALCSVALIYSFADVSGAHFNPAVTFATIVTGKVSLKKGLMFIAVQLLAAIVATAFLMVVFPHPMTGNDSRLLDIPGSVVVNIDPSAPLVNAFFMELILTFVLVYVIFATAFDTVDTSNKVKVAGAANKDSEAGKNLTIYTTSGNTKAGFAPIAIGFTLGFLCLLGGSVSGGAFNPARVFGPAVLTGNFSNNWVYWVGDFMGAALAGWTQHLFAHEAVQNSHAVGTKGNSS
ncbi:aquaporin-like protein [Chytriomyces sp. MP71]|nr:aquaporin-like protein [Chytriomyces sp. MP71]